MNNSKTIITVRKDGNSHEKLSADSKSQIHSLRDYSWHDVIPLSLILWPQTFSEAEYFGSWWRERHNYHSLTLELMLAGELQYKQNGQSIIVRKGDLYFSHPGNTVKTHSSKCEYARQLQLVISGQQLPSLLQSLELRQTYLLPGGNGETIAGYFNAIGDLLLGKTSAMLASSKTYELLAWLANEKDTLEQSQLPPVLTRAVRIMSNELSRGHTIADIAKLAGTSQTTLARLFRQHCQTTPQAYFTTLKMEFACNLLKLNRYSCQEIAEQLGFKKAMYFSTAFNRYTGLSPREYRAAARREKTDPAQSVSASNDQDERLA